MSFPKKPVVLDLTPLEERLVSPRIPFMQIRELPRGGQLLIQGNVVNVPSDVNSTVHTLPRPINESQTIPIKLKRSLSYKHHYQFQNVRPMKVLEAAKYLVNTRKVLKYKIPGKIILNLKEVSNKIGWNFFKIMIMTKQIVKIVKIKILQIV